MIISNRLPASNDWFTQLVRYGAVSAVALSCDVGILLFLHNTLDLQYLIAASFSFLVGVTIVYIGSIYWVFTKHTIASRKREFFIFALIGVASLLFNDLLLAFFVEIVTLTVLTAKLLTVGLVFAFNFIVRKIILFS